MLVEHSYDLVGNTPLLELTNIEKLFNLKGRVFAKVELFNPAGSVKDRIALNMILKAEQEGLLKEGSTIIEPTSGNTGIGLASIGAAMGYKVILTMPSSMSIERQKLLKAYGAQLVLTEPSLGMQGAVDKANELAKEIEGGVVLGQFINPHNPEAHYMTTGPEIYKDLEGDIDVFVAGIGTGGTISGVGKYLKEHCKSVEVIGVEPASSPLISEGKAGSHKIQGIGANFIPDTLDMSIIDKMVTVSNEDAFEYARLVGRHEGLLVGISSGAALKAAIDAAKDKDDIVVVLFPDSGDRYLSTDLFNNL